MPVQVQKSALMSSLKPEATKAVREAASGEIDWGTQRDLPPGIKDGVARLTQCYFKQYDKDGSGGVKKGTWYYRAVGVVVEPQSVIVDGREVPVAGRQTSEFAESLCDTVTQSGKVTTQAEHVANVVNKMRMLGAEFPADASPALLEPTAKALQDTNLPGNQPIYFRFSTSVRKAQKTGDADGVWENWHGIKDIPEDYSPPDAGEAAVNDQSEGQPTAEEGASEESQPGSEEEVDLDALAVEADGMDVTEALAPDGPGTKIKEAAVQVGADVDAVSAANTWAEAVEIIKAVIGAGDDQQPPEPEPEPPAPWKPKKGEVVGYKVPVTDPKTKKTTPGKKATQCEVGAVNNKSGTCDLIQLANRKVVYKGVKLEAVEQLS